MEILRQDLDGIVLLKPKIFEDKRGYFFESFNEDKFNDKLKIRIRFIQDNESNSKKGILRGFHFQKPPHSQSKLVRVTQGKVQDVVIDVRPQSKFFGQHRSYILSNDNKHQLFIPKGFAHAFLVLSETATFNYKVDHPYMPDFDSGLIWNDPVLKVNWELNMELISLSDKDKNLQNFNTYSSNNKI